MKRLGPELKVPDLQSLKVPPVLRDLYQDLRERRLLPLIALILVGIVATPFLLGSGSSMEEAAPSPSVPLEAPTSSAGNSLTVVKAEPGLRDYRKRLRHRKATNPFKPHFTGPVLAGTQLNGSPESTSSTSTTTTSESSGSATVESGSSPSTSLPSESSGGAPAGGGNDSGDGGGDTTTGGQQLTFYAFAIDVKITKTTTKPNGEKSKPEEIEKQRVLPPAALPGEKAQVVTYMGISPTTKKPLLLVSEDVESVFGETDCLAGSGHCQLIEVEPQMPVTFFYGENQVRYKVNIIKVEAVATGHS